MIWTIFVILVILWLLGLVSSYTMGGVHPYFTRRSSHCAGGRPLSETITLFICWGKEGKADAKEVSI